MVKNKEQMKESEIFFFYKECPWKTGSGTLFRDSVLVFGIGGSRKTVSVNPATVVTNFLSELGCRQTGQQSL